VAEVAPDPVEQQELHDHLSAALAQLNDDQRAALVLVDVEGYPVAEAAVILGVAEGTIKSRCARGRARLAVTLGHLRNPEPDGGVPSQSRREGGVGG
jgi:RNA polymerase sigma-70 factor (ECF subfamily)